MGKERAERFVNRWWLPVFLGLLVCAATALMMAGVLLLTPKDTAHIYFSDLYQMDGELPLHQWQLIRVNGEDFHACAITHAGGGTILTVNPDDFQRCGPLNGVEQPGGVSR